MPFAAQAGAVQLALDAVRELDAKTQHAARDAGAKNERVVLELKAEIAKTQAEIIKTQQAILELKAHVDVRLARQEARMDGQFRLLHWMFTALFGVSVAIALKLFL